jgi:7-cyano-7-deazaguanine synthase
VNPSVEVGTYSSTADLPGGVEPTFIPARNPLFLTIAANRAALIDAKVLVTGLCEVDYGGYYDCRGDFLKAMERMLSQALFGNAFSFKIVAPLLHRTKAGSVELARSLPGCLEALAYSHTCYQGSFPPCRICHACLLRQKGFDEAGILDPLLMRIEK